MESLKQKHKELDNQINELYKHTNTEDKISVLKKQKLLIKDKITKLQQTGDNDG
jgi:hypothetical protein